MGKAKRTETKKGASKKAVKPTSVTPKHEEKRDENAGTIGIGLPMSDEEMQKLKEKARKLDH